MVQSANTWSITHDGVRETFVHYYDVRRLAESSIAKTPLVTDMLLIKSPSVETVGLFVRSTLDWALMQLQRSGKVTWITSYETLKARYIERLSVSKYSLTADIVEQTIEKRRLSATKKIASILQEELTKRESIDERHQILFRYLYDALSADEQRGACVLSLLGEPVNRVLWSVHDDVMQIDLVRAIPVLADKNIITIDVDNGQHYMTMQADVVAFIRQLISYAEMQRLHRWISSIYVNLEQPFAAIRHLHHANAFEEAATLVADLRPQLASYIVEMDAVLPLFERPMLSHTDLWVQILFCRGQIAMSKNDITVAVQIYESILGVTRQHYDCAEAHFALANVRQKLHEYEAALLHSRMGRNQLRDKPESQSSQWMLLLARFYLVDLFTNYHTAPENIPDVLSKVEEIAEQHSPNTGDWLELKYRLWLFKGNYFASNEQADDAIEAFWQARLYAIQTGNLAWLGNVCLSLGRIYMLEKHDYDRALTYYQEGFDAADKHHHTDLMVWNYKGIGNVYWFKKAYEDAIVHYRQAIDLLDVGENTFILRSLHHDLADALLSNGQIAEALIAFQFGWERVDQINENFSLASYRKLREQHPIFQFELNARQTAVLEVMLRENRPTSTSRYETTADCSKRTALNDLTELVELGLLEKVGVGRGTKYVRVSATVD